jgi:hypothetical protein
MAAIVPILMLLTGFADPVPMDARLEPVFADPLPLAIGVHYPPVMSDSESVIGEPDGATSTFPIGVASISVLDQAMVDLFRRVEAVEHRPPVPGAGGTLEAVIEPSIADFTWSVERLPSSSWMPVVVYLSVDASIEYIFTLHSMGGDVIGSWHVRGGGTKLIPDGETADAALRGEVASMALRNAARRFMAEFRTQPEIRDWLDRRLGPEKAR